MVIERLHVILAPQVLSITSFQNPLQNVPLYTHKCTMSQYGLQISPNSVDDLIALLVIICSGFSSFVSVARNRNMPFRTRNHPTCVIYAWSVACVHCLLPLFSFLPRKSFPRAIQ